MTLPQRLLSVLSESFRIDFRALAILRMGMAIVILWDLASRWSWIKAFYTDEAFFTRDLSKACNNPAAWSLYWIDGSATFATVLMILTAVSAVFLLIGYRTKIATVVCLILCYSMFVRMPLVLDGGHVLLRMLLFWSVFLPLGRVWSVDAKRHYSKTPERYAQSSISNIATAAIMLQFASMYFFSGIAKCNSDWWFGNAIFNAMSLEMYTWGTADIIKSLPPGFLLWFGRALVVFEIVGPILLFVPKYDNLSRPVLLAVFWSMHIGIWLTMSIGIFAATAMLGWILFVPLKPRGDLNKGPQEAPTAQSGVRHQSPSTWYFAGQIFCGFALAFVILLNISNVDNQFAKLAMPEALKPIGWLTMTAQEFKMFGKPPQHNVRPRLSLSTEQDSLEFDLDDYRSFDPDNYIYSPSHATRRLNYNLVYFYALDKEIVNRVRQEWGKYLTQKWLADNSQSDQQLKSAILECELIPIVQHSVGQRQVWWKSE